VKETAHSLRAREIKAPTTLGTSSRHLIRELLRMNSLEDAAGVAGQ
jgi:hypothetical protein